MAKKKLKYNDNNLAIAYYRYSSHAQNETSIDQQREAAQRYAEAHGLTVVREYEDAAISGTEENRLSHDIHLAQKRIAIRFQDRFHGQVPRIQLRIVLDLPVIVIDGLLEVTITVKKSYTHKT